jgi:hypothetical protein
VSGSEIAEGTPIVAFALIGNGESAILTTKNIAACFSMTGTPSEKWSFNIAGLSKAGIHEVLPLDAQRVVLRLGGGVFKVLDVISGTVQYNYDPAVRAGAASNPAQDKAFWVKYNPCPGPSAGTVTLFNGGSTAYTLTVATGALSERQIDVTIPDGFVLRRGVDHQRLVLLAAQQVKIRPLAP